MNARFLAVTKPGLDGATLPRSGVLLVLLLTCLVLAACASGPDTRHERFVFTHDAAEISGVLQLPQSAGPHPAVIFVHGDGEMTWDGYGYYTPMQEAMIAAGFAVLSWDKPGVGNSTGNWLSQSMQERADMVATASRLLKARGDIQAGSVGLWGISQAGWVMPIALTQTDDFAFMISVSGAVNWKQQSRFYMQNRLEMDGYDAQETAAAFAFEDKADALLEGDDDYKTYAGFIRSAPPCCRALMKENRWEFVRKNINSDAEPYLQGITVPVLAIFGDKDLNVDVEDSIRRYTQSLAMSGNPDFEIKVFENANHSLIPAQEGQISGRGSSAYQMILSIRSQGADAFAPGYIDFTVAWLSERFTQNQTPNPLGE